MSSRHQDECGENISPVFLDCKGFEVTLPTLKLLEEHALGDYSVWLGGIVERINAAFHPRFPGM